MIVKNIQNQEVIIAEFTVTDKEYVSPNLIRVTFSSESIHEYAEVTAGSTIKIFLPHPQTDTIIYPAWLNIPQENPEKLSSIYRTYTVRDINAEENQLAIEFVAHGDGGPASQWALQAQEGQKIAIATKKRTISLVPQKDWYLFAVDHTGLPVCSKILETLSPEAEGIAVIEVLTEADILDLKKPEKISIQWLINPHPGENELLAEKVRTLALQDIESKYAFVAAEFKNVKNIRYYLRKELQWNIHEIDALSYWKLGKAETESAAERHDENHEADHH